MTTLTGFWIVTTFLFGIATGSFLNVVIYRLPKASAELNLSTPTWSFCPNCKNRLTALDLIPLFSFLLLGRKCRYCKTPISWRYFSIELLTGALFVASYLRFSHFPQDAPNCIALLLFTTVLIPIFFIDWATFHIPDSLNLLLFLIPLARDVWGIATHEPGHALVWGWLPRSILGAVVGILIFGAVRVAGWLWKKQEAMGLGDVLMARGMGAMLVSVVSAKLHALSLFPAWVLLSCLAGIAVGYPLLYQRGRMEAASGAAPAQEEEEDLPMHDGSTLGKELLAVGYVLWLGDALDYIKYKIHLARGGEDIAAALEDDDWTPAPTAIPFGPFLVIGFLLTVFFGEWMTAAYLAYAFSK